MARGSGRRLWLGLLAVVVALALYLLSNPEGFQTNSAVITAQRQTNGTMAGLTVSGDLPATSVTTAPNRLTISSFPAAMATKRLTGVVIEYRKKGETGFTVLPSNGLNATPTKIGLELGNNKPLFLSAPLRANQRQTGDAVLPVPISELNTKGGLRIKNIDVASLGNLEDFLPVQAGRAARGAAPPQPTSTDPNIRVTLNFSD